MKVKATYRRHDISDDARGTLKSLLLERSVCRSRKAWDSGLFINAISSMFCTEV